MSTLAVEIKLFIPKTTMERHNFVTIEDLSKEKLLYLLEMAKEFEKHPNRELL